MINIGDRIGGLVVVEITNLHKGVYRIYNCQCECGEIVQKTSKALSESRYRKLNCRCEKCRIKYYGDKKVMDIVKETGKAYSTIAQRIKSGHNPYVDCDKGAGKKKKDLGLDKEYSFTDLAKMTGINRTTLIERYKRGVRGKALLSKKLTN